MSCGLDHLACAIDGITQESYGKYRVGGQVENALANLQLIAEERDKQKSPLIIEWQFLVNKFNQGEMEEARRIAEKINVIIRFAPMRGMEWDVLAQDQWLSDALEWRIGELRPGAVANPYHCYHLWRTIVLNSNGRLSRCPIYQNVAEYADLHESSSVMALYNGSSSQRARQLFTQNKVGDGEFPSPCNTCSFFKREHGGPYQDKGWTNPIIERAPGGKRINLE